MVEPWLELERPPGTVFLDASVQQFKVCQPVHPPDFINIKVEELVGDRPFENLDDYITQDELRALSEHYKRIAGFALRDVGRS